MTYEAQETGAESGAPVELYTFTHGASAYRYTSREVDYTDTTVSPNRTYASASIDRSAIESTQEDARNTLTLTVPRNLSVAELFRVAPPSDAVAVTVKRVHRGDTTDVIVVWMGRVLSCVFEGASAKLECEPITVSMKRTGLRRLYGKACPFALYGAGCGLDKTAFDTATTVSAISGLTLTVASLGSFTDYGGGFVEWVNGSGNTERRFIESNASTVLTLTQPFTGISNGANVTIYPGCDHTLATCNSVFNNAVSYGGWPFMPTKNPFAGNPVY